MRRDIKMLCVTNWNAVLELKHFWAYHYPCREYDPKELVNVADPKAFNAGLKIPLSEIKLVARIKR